MFAAMRELSGVAEAFPGGWRGRGPKAEVADGRGGVGEAGVEMERVRDTVATARIVRNGWDMEGLRRER